MKYFVVVSTLNTPTSPTMTFQLNRQIPSGSKISLYQFNYDITSDAQTSAPAYDVVIDKASWANTSTGILVCLDNLINTKSFSFSTDSSGIASTTTLPILDVIPVELFISSSSSNTRKRLGSYAPKVNVPLEISSPISAIDMSLRNARNGELHTASQLEKYVFTFTLLIEE